MLSLPASVRVYLSTAPADLRRSFDGLSVLVQQVFGREPLDGHLFLFLNRRRDRLKILYWDRDGLALWYKRLEAGTFQLPWTAAMLKAWNWTPRNWRCCWAGSTSVRRSVANVTRVPAEDLVAPRRASGSDGLERQGVPAFRELVKRKAGLPFSCAKVNEPRRAQAVERLGAESGGRGSDASGGGGETLENSWCIVHLPLYHFQPALYLGACWKRCISPTTWKPVSNWCGSWRRPTRS